MIPTSGLAVTPVRDAAQRLRGAAWLLLRREGANAVGIFAHSIILPTFICYAGFMVAPDDVAARQRWVLGGLVLALGMTSLTQVHFSVASDRLLGGLRLLSAHGVDRVTYVIAYLGYGMLLALVVAVAGAAFMTLTHLSAVGPAAAPDLLLLAGLSGLLLGTLGLLTASSIRDFGTGDVVVNLLGLVFVLVSPVFYPMDALPGFIRPIGSLSPYTHIATLAAQLARGEQLAPVHLLALAGMEAFFAAILVWRLRRNHL